MVIFQSYVNVYERVSPQLCLSESRPLSTYPPGDRKVQLLKGVVLGFLPAPEIRCGDADKSHELKLRLFIKKCDWDYIWDTSQIYSEIDDTMIIKIYKV